MSDARPAGCVMVLGLGPGDPALRTEQVRAALARATDLVGYATYLDRVGLDLDVRRHASDNRQELDRARRALALAAQGCKVAVVSSGDAGIFAMASAVFEAIEHGEPGWRELEVSVFPGISAMLAVAARLGAPLGHDFCVLSLSDNLKPWPVIVRRLRMAAECGLAITLYNPVSNSRPWQLDEAFGQLREILPGTIPVVFATAISRADEHVVITSLAEANAQQADMRTLILIGNADTRLIAREGKRPFIYAPRSERPRE